MNCTWRGPRFADLRVSPREKGSRRAGGALRPLRAGASSGVPLGAKGRAWCLRSVLFPSPWPLRKVGSLGPQLRLVAQAQVRVAVAGHAGGSRGQGVSL